jgi:hypothetical protein
LDAAVATQESARRAAALDKVVEQQFRASTADGRGRSARHQPDQRDQEVRFFETPAKAESVVFVVDCSLSMTGSRSERTRLELARSIADLHPDKRFFVVYFNTSAIPMAIGLQTQELVAASAQMKFRTLEWVNTVPVGGGTRPEPALLVAAQLKPTVIYLLSDGNFSALRAATFEAFAQNQIVVHTLAFEDASGARNLEDIARRTAGTYRFVPAGAIPPYARQDISNRMIEELIAGLHATNPADREETRRALVHLTGGVDFGPPPAATAPQVDQAIAAWSKWRGDRLLADFATRDRTSVVALFRSADVLERWAAVSVARQRRLDVPAELIEQLADPSTLVVQEARGALVQLAGIDYGPPDGGTDEQRTRALADWRAWLPRRARRQALLAKYLKRSEADVARSISAADADERWAGVAAARQRSLQAPDPLIRALSDTDMETRQLARQALVQLAGGSDYGPEESASAAARATALANWKAWALREKEKRAQHLLRLAKQLHDIGRLDAARKRFQAIVDDFAGTEAAKEAQAMLGSSP